MTASLPLLFHLACSQNAEHQPSLKMAAAFYCPVHFRFT
jgi:hypothetical protein